MPACPWACHNPAARIPPVFLGLRGPGGPFFGLSASRKSEAWNHRNQTMVSKFATVSRIALFAGALALGGGAALAQTTATPAPTTSTTTAAPAAAPTTAAPAMTQAAPATAPKVEAGKTDQKPAAAKSGTAVSQDTKVEKHSSALHRSHPRHQHIVKTSAEKVDGSAAAKTSDMKTAPATAGQKAETGKTDAKPGAIDT